MRKTHKAVAKRFKVTGTGKLKHSKTCKSHLLTNKSSAAKKRQRYGKLLAAVEMKRMKMCLPHSM
jgi:large subunit ribosomal protein L35